MEERCLLKRGSNAAQEVLVSFSELRDRISKPATSLVLRPVPATLRDLSGHAARRAGGLPRHSPRLPV